MSSRPWPYLVDVLALAVVYFAAARLGLSLAAPDAPEVTVVWPPTGIALAALLFGGDRLWPGVALGAFLANMTVQEPVFVALGITVGNTLEAVLGARLLRRIVGFHESLERLRDVLGLVVLAAGISTAVAASVGVLSLCLGGVHQWSEFGPLWRTWWLGDAMGDLVMAPALLAWAARPRLDGPPGRTAEAAALLFGLGMVSAAVFSGGGPRPTPGDPLEYTIFPFVIWAALRFGPRGTVAVTLTASAVAILGTVGLLGHAGGAGPFAGGAAPAGLVQLQFFMGVVAVTGLLLGAAIAERRLAERRRAVGYAVTTALAESTSLAQAAPRLLQAVCESLGWDVGALWSVDRPAGLLRCVEVWCRPGATVAEFEAATRRHAFAPGVGLPGRVWTRREAAWIEDVTQDANFPRAAAAAHDGLHGAFGFPVLLGAEVVGVIEFFSREIQQPDDDLLAMLAAVSHQVGLFSEHERAADELRRERELLQKVFDRIPVMIVMYEPSAKVLRLNREFERLTGWTTEEARGIDLMARCYPDPVYRNEVRAFMDALLEGWKDICMTTRDGRELQSSWSNVRLSDDTHVGIGLDIRERKRLERELRGRADQLAEADRRKDEFLAMLAHELRNPLAPIRNAVQLLKMPGADAATAERARDLLERQVQHLVRLVDDLLDVSRIMRGRIELRRERIDLAAVVARAVETAQPAIEAGGHELTVALPAEPVTLEADPVRFAQVIGNLLNNSAKYTERSGRIQLSANREGGAAVVRVRDSGIGIPADVLPHVFDPFMQADRSLDRAQGGLGIGLTLVRNLMELHGGTVEAHSAGPGMGSEFVVRLPAIPNQDAPASETHLDVALAGASNSKARRVLVVDDNVDAADSLALLLRSDGHDVRVAYNGASALTAAATEPPEVVFLDIGMPDMDGFEVARRLRSALPGVQLVAVTGWGQDEDRRGTSEAGFDRHLVKPVDIDQLRGLLNGGAA